MTRIPLQWVDEKFFDENAMLNNGKEIDDAPVGPVYGFEASAHKVKAPEKTLNVVDDEVSFQLDFPCPRNTCFSCICLRGSSFEDHVLHTPIYVMLVPEHSS